MAGRAPKRPKPPLSPLAQSMSTGYKPGYTPDAVSEAERILAKDAAASKLTPPIVHTAGENEWLAQNVQRAIQEGVPSGVSGFDRPIPAAVRHAANDREFLYGLQKQLESLGIQGLDDFGVNDLPRVGAFKVAFGAGDNVVKLALPDSTDYDMRLPQGVWGVSPPSAGWRAKPITTEDSPFIHDGLDVVVQPRVLLTHPKWGTASDQDAATLSKALDYQGWGWTDSHTGNLGFLPGREYKPTVIDGDVLPASWRQTVSFPFRPPTKPDWYYSVILPALLAGGGESERQQPSGPLSGLTREINSREQRRRQL